MSEWLDSQKKPDRNFRELLKERFEKTNPHRELTSEEVKRLAKLELIADKIRRGENVQSGIGLTHLLHTHYLYNLSY